MKEPAMPIGPVHHGGDRYFPEITRTCHVDIRQTPPSQKGRIVTLYLFPSIMKN
jgi:hypothetical protein